MRPSRPMRLLLIPPIHRATHRLGLYVAALRNQQLTQGEAHILAYLAGRGPATVGELHKVLAHKRSTLTSILDRLAERALVTRETGTTDRRTFVVALTRKGERAAREILHHLADLERAVRQKFPAETIDAFLAVLSAVEDAAAQRSTGKTKTA